MRKLLLYFGIALVSIVYAQTLPYTAINPGSINQNLRSGPGTSYAVVAQLAPQKHLVIRTVSGAWGIVDLPGVTVAETAYTNITCPTNMLYDPALGQVSVTGSMAAIRVSASLSAATVTINSATANVFSGQRYAVESSSVVSGTTWYKIQLPSTCSQNFGWLPSTMVQYTAPASGAVRPAVPTISSTSSTNTSVTIHWTAAGATGIKVYNCNGTFVGLYNSSPAVVTGLNPNTTYDFQLEGDNSWTNSCLTSCFTVVTTGGSASIPNADFTYSPANPTISQNITFTNTSTNYSSLSWNFGDGTTSTATSPTKSYAVAGTYLVTLNVTNSSGNTDNITKTVTVSNAPVTSVQVDNLIFTATTITVNGNLRNLSGNVSVKISGCGTALRFGSPIQIDMTTKVISGNCLVYVPNINGVNKNLYSGPFSFTIAGSAIDLTSNSLLNQVLKLVQLDLPIHNLTVICDGVIINGQIKLPASLTKLSGGTVSAGISALSMRQSSGIWLAGNLSAQNVRVYQKLNLKSLNVTLETTPIELLEGSASLTTPIVNVDAYTLLKYKRLDSLGITVTPTKPAPLGTTGLALYQASGSIANLKNTGGTLAFGLGAVIVPAGPGMSSVSNLTVNTRYVLGNYFSAWGTLKMFNQSVANAGFTAWSNRFDMYGNASWIGIVHGHISASVYKYQPYPVQVRGRFGLTVTMPNYSTIQNKTVRLVLKQIYNPGETIAQSDNYLCNTYVSGYAWLNLWALPRVSYKLDWQSGSLRPSFGYNYNALPLQAKTALGVNQRTSSNISDGTYNFSLNQSTERLMIEGIAPASLPSMVIYLPWGDSVTAANIAQYSNMQWFSDVNDKFLSLMIQYPKLGDYQVKVSNIDSLFVSRENMRPALHLQNVVVNSSAKSLNINWKDSDIDNDAQISLFLDTDTKGANGVSFVENISEDDLADAFTLQYGNMPTGDYYVGGTIVDDLGQSHTTYFDTPIRLLTDNAPSAPVLNSISGNDSSIVGNMSRTSPTGMNYVLYYSDKYPVSFSSPSIAIEDSSDFSVMRHIASGKTYWFAVSVMDSLFRESDLSNMLSLNYQTTTNNTPFIPVQNYAATLAAGNTYSYQLNAVDADNEPLTYTLTDAPLGMSINNSGQITWNTALSDAGYYQVSVRVSDAAGAYDSSFWQVLVIPALHAVPHVSFSKALYLEQNDGGLVEIYDAAAGLDYWGKDVVSVRLSSNSDLVGINLSANESSAESRSFEVYFEIGAISAGNILHAVKGDTIWATYTNALGNTYRQMAFVSGFEGDFEMNLSSCTETSQFRSSAKGDNLRYIWNFGDGSPTEFVKNPAHIFSGAGPYTVTVSITDEEGNNTVVSKIAEPECITLASPLFDFQGKVEATQNVLTWSLNANASVSSFSILRSENGTDFTEIATQGVDNRASYQYVDVAPFKRSFYKLNVLNQDGSSSSSAVIELLQKTSYELVAYPNPAKENFTLAIVSAGEEATLRVFDAKGARILQEVLSLHAGENQHFISTQDWQSGAYLIELSIGENVYTQKINVIK